MRLRHLPHQKICFLPFSSSGTLNPSLTVQYSTVQVAGPVHPDGSELQKLVPDVGGLTINDDLTNGFSGNQSNGFARDDKLPTTDALKEEATVGSLSFTLMDTSTSKQSSGLSGQASSANAGNSVEVSPKPKAAAVKKPAPRPKVPFEKGYSQMDWLKLTRTHPDLAGLKGQSNRRLISMNEVKQHQTEGSMWTVLKGRVYNLSPYMKFHPGGVDILMKAVGKDCTSLFNKYHAWVNAEFLLEKCLVGTLDDGQ